MKRILERKLSGYRHVYISMIILLISFGAYAQPNEVQDILVTPTSGFGQANDIWQSFTPTQDGRLVKFTFDAGGNSPAGNRTVSIYEGEGTGGTLLQSFTYNFAGNTNVVSVTAVVDLPTPIQVTQGNQYTWQVTNINPRTLINTSPNTYTGGTGFATFNGTPFTNFDIGFSIVLDIGTNVSIAARETLSTTDPFFFDVTFYGSPTNLESSDFNVTNGTVSGLSMVSAQVYALSVSTTSDGTVTVNFPAGGSLVDGLGNDAATANTEVDLPPFQNPNLILTKTQIVQAGTQLFLNNPSVNTTLFFAPEGTTNFTPGPTITQGTATPDINAPSTPGEYKLFLTDGAGTVQAVSSTSLFVTTSSAATTAAIKLNDQNILTGETAQVTFSFLGAVTGFTNDDLTVPNGTLSTVSSSDGNITFTATYTPNSDVVATSNVITLDNTGITDGATAGTGTTDSENFAVDTGIPKVASILCTSGCDNVYTAAGSNRTLAIDVNFDRAVTLTGSLALELAFQFANKTATVTQNSAQSFTATYTLTQSDLTTQLDYTSTSALTLATASTLTGSSNGSTADLTLAAPGAVGSISENRTIYIDLLAPQIVTINRNNPTGEITNQDEVTFRVTFTEAIEATSFGNDFTVSGTAATGASVGSAVMVDATNYDYTVSGISNSNGTIGLDYSGSLSDLTTNNLLAGGDPATASQDQTYTLDNTRPTVTINMANTALKVGETSLLTFTFDEAVTGFTNQDLTIPNGTLTAVTATDATNITFTATYTPNGSTEVSSNVITLNGAGVADLAGNTIAGNIASNMFAIDNVIPTVSIATSVVSPTVANPIPVTITFSEPVNGFALDDFSLTNGSAQNLQTSDNTVFTVDIVPGAEGLVSFRVVASAATDALGNSHAQSNLIEINFKIAEIAYGTSFDLSNGISVVGGPFDINDEHFAVSGLTFSADGSRMFTTGTVSPRVNRYNLSQAFDISTASFGGTSQDLSIINEERTALDVVFSPDGMKLFISGFNPSPSSLQQYNLTSAYNVHTASAASDFSVNSQDTRPHGFAFSSDGTKLFMVGQNNLVFQYSLTTGFDLSTISYDNVSFNVSGQDNASRDIDFSSDGLKMFILGDGGNEVNQYNLNAPFDITSATFETRVAVGSQEGSPNGFAFSSDGTKLFITGTAGDDVNQYDIGRGGFKEAVANDGSLEGSISVSLEDDTFINAGGTLTFGTDYSVTGIPAGLTPVLSVAANGKSAVLTLTGNATSNNNSDDVSNLQFTFENSAFTNATAANVTNAVNANSNLGIDFIQFPAVEIQNAPSNTNAAFTVTFQFDEDVTGFELADIQVANGQASAFTSVDANTYTALITPTAEGQVTIDVNASVAVNSENSNNTAAIQAVINYDTTSPILTITNVPANSNAAFTATFGFSEDVVGFEASDVVLTNATISAFTTTNSRTYTALITPSSEGQVTLGLAQNAAQDNEGNISLLAAQVTSLFDTTAPTVSFSGVPSNSNAAFTATITFSEDVTGFSLGDITLSNATASSFTSTDAKKYSVLITPTAEGSVTLDIAASAAQDVAGNGNAAATQATSTFDTTAPTVSISGVPSSGNSAFTASITFSENVSGFSVGDITLNNATAGAFTSTDAKNYTVLITPTAEGAVTLDITAGKAQDAAGNSNTAATQATSTYDITSPTVSLSGVPSNGNSAFTVSIAFSEDVSGFSVEDITLSNATASAFASTDAKNYTVLVTPMAEGAVTLDIAANASQDAAGNGNAAATQATSTHDTTAPTVSISGVSSSSNAAFTASITFIEDVTGFSVEDITLSNATASSFTATDAKNYTVLVTPTAEGSVTLDIAANAAQDAAGNGNTAANQATSTYDTTAPTVSISGAPSSGNAAFTASFAFSEDVTGFAVEDIALTNATASSFASTDAKNYTVLVTPTAEGAVTLDIAANAAQDAAGNGNAAATQATSIHDTTAPTISISGVPSIGNSAFTASIAFSENISGFTVEDITLSNATASSFTGTDAKNYSVVITPAVDGTVTLDIAASLAQDAAGNGNVAATKATSTYDATAPTVAISSASTSPVTGAFPVSVVFSESVTGFALEDITVTNGTASGFTGSGSSYGATITPATSGTTTVSVVANKANDNAGNANAASNTLSIEFTPEIVKTPTSVEIVAIADKNLGDPAFELVANTTPAGTPVVWSVVSGSATVSGSTLTLGTVSGTVTVQATIVENETLLGSSDTEVFELLDPVLTTPVITFQLPTAVTIIETVELTASLDAQGATSISVEDIVYSVTSGPGQIDGSVLSFTGTGSVEVTASIAATSTTNSASSTQSILVNPVFTVSGMVTDNNGAAFSDGTVVITDINDLTNSQSVSLDAAGEYMFLNLIGSEYQILVNTPSETFAATYYGNVSTVLDPNAVVKATVVDADLTGINIQMQAKPTPAVDFLPPEEGGTINFQAQSNPDGGRSRFYQGRVEMGEPLANTLVMLRTTADEYVADGLTDVDGNIVFEGLPDGDYKLQVDVPGVGLVSTDVGVTEGEEAVLTGVLSDEGVAFEEEEVLSADLNSTQQLEVYPNPVATNFTVSFANEFIGEVRVQIVNITGQVIHTSRHEKYQQEFSTELALDAPVGIYFLRVRSDSNMEVKRILKQ